MGTFLPQNIAVIIALVKNSDKMEVAFKQGCGRNIGLLLALNVGREHSLSPTDVLTVMGGVIE